MSANFSVLKKLDNVESLNPIGTPFCRHQRRSRDRRAGRTTPLAAEFKFKILQADEDVDAEALAEMAGSRTGNSGSPWLTEDALWRAKQFVENCGVDDTGMSVWQALQACVGMSAKGRSSTSRRRTDRNCTRTSIRS